MFLLLRLVRKNGMFSLFLVLILLSSLLVFQHLYLQRIKVDLETTRADLSSIRSAIALTDNLRRDNAILTQERDDLRTELKNARGYHDPLPPDIRNAIGRMRF